MWMFVRLIRRCHRDRRRIAVAFALLFGAGVVEVWGKFQIFPPGVLEVFVGLGLMSFVGFFLLMAGLALPNMRHIYAPLGFTLFGAAVLGRVFPGSAFSLLTITEGGVRAIGGLATMAIFVHLFFYGRWSDRVFKSGRARTTARATSQLEADILWHGLVPTPGRRESLHDPDVLSVDWVDRERSRVRIIRWSPPEAKYEEHIQIEDMMPGTFVLYSYVREIKGSDKIEKGIRAVKMIDMVDKRVVYVTEYRHDRALRHVLFDWIDDALGRKLDAQLAHLEASVNRARFRGAVRRDHLAVGGVLRPGAEDRPKRLALAGE